MRELNYCCRRPVIQDRKCSSLTVFGYDSVNAKLGRRIFGDRSISFEIVLPEIMSDFREFCGDLISKNAFEWRCTFLTIFTVFFGEDH